MQGGVAPRGDPVGPTDLTETEERIAADRSGAFPVFVFLAFACFWLIVGSVAGLVASIKLHDPDSMQSRKSSVSIAPRNWSAMAHSVLPSCFCFYSVISWGDLWAGV